MVYIILCINKIIWIIVVLKEVQITPNLLEKNYLNSSNILCKYLLKDFSRSVPIYYSLPINGYHTSNTGKPPGPVEKKAFEGGLTATYF